jgi:hypothetical protein
MILLMQLWDSSRDTKMNNLGLMGMLGGYYGDSYQPPGIGMFGGALGGQMSATDPLTLYLTRKHQEAAEKQRQQYIRDLLMRLPQATQAPKMFNPM